MHRLYEAKDRDQLISAMNCVCAEAKWMSTTQYISTSAWEAALTFPDDPSAVVIVDVEANTIVGWCRVFLDEQGAELGIGIIQGYRNQGRGKRLLTAGLAWCNAHHQHPLIVRLTCRLDNVRAQCLFRQYGFIEVHRENNVGFLVNNLEGAQL